MNVQSRNCCSSNKFSKPSTRYTKGCEQGRHNRSQRKKQHSTISMKAQRSSSRDQATSRNPNFALFVLIFWYFFLILYHLNRKHTNFQLDWTEGVAYKNSIIFSTKFKASSRLWVRCLRSRIWASCHGQTRLGWGLVGCEIWFYPISKKVPQSEFICKSYDRFTKARPGYGSGRRNMTRHRNWVRQKLTVCDSKGWSNGWKSSNRVSHWS
jgi:hypothetical protein